MKPQFVYIDYSHELDAPAGELFGLLVKIGDWPRWVRRIPFATQLDAGPWQVGTRIRFKPDFAPAAMTMRVFHYEEDRVVGWGIGSPAHLGDGPLKTWRGSIEHRFDFEPLPGGRTRVRHREIAEGPLALATRVMQPAVWRFNKDWADDLERWVNERRRAPAGGGI